MELVILKNGHIFARANDPEANESDVYYMAQIPDDSMPEYPADPAPVGYRYALDLVNGSPAWVLHERPLTAEERMQIVESRLDAMEYPEFVQPSGAHDAYKQGDKVTFDGKHYVSIFDGANVWSPADYPDGWEMV